MNAFAIANTYNFTKGHIKTNCKYMRMLKAMIDHPDGLTKAETYAITHKMDNMPNDGWGSCTWSAFHHYGYADFKRIGHKVKWFITNAGKAFYYQNFIKHDLIAA